MSGRGATVAFLAEAAKDEVYLVHLLEIEFNPTTIYMTDASTNLVWNGNTYLASQYLGFSEIAETSELFVNTCTVSLSGVDQAVPAALLQETYLNRKIRIRTAFLTESLAVISDPLLMFDGRMDSPSISVDPDSGLVVCAVECVSHWSDFERRSGRHSNNVEQQKFYPGDKGFAAVASIKEEIFWGIAQKIGRDR